MPSDSRDDEGRPPVEDVPASVEGASDAGDDNSPSASVNLLAVLPVLLRCSLPARDVYWVAFAHGATQPGGWSRDRVARAAEWADMRGTKYSARRARDGVSELVEAGLLRPRLGPTGDVNYVVNREPATMFDDDERGGFTPSYSPIRIGGESHTECLTDPENPRNRDSASDDAGHSPAPRGNAGTGQSGAERAIAPVLGLDGEPTTVRKLAGQLVELWARRSGRPRAKVLEPRVRMVHSRLREGFTTLDLARAIAGVCYSPFHREGGYDTFEVALRNGQQVEKGAKLWDLHAPIEVVERHTAATGRVVEARTEELASRERERVRDADFERRVAEARAAREREQQARDEEERRDEQATAMALAGLDGEE